MRYIDYVKEHAIEVANLGMNKNYPKSLVGKLYNPKKFERQGWSFTLIDEGYPIFCGGIHPLWEGVGEVWFFASHKLNKHPLKYIRSFKKKAQELVKEKEIVRLQAPIRKEFKEAKRFTEWWGMKEEGIMKKYYDGHDYYMMGWVK